LFLIICFRPPTPMFSILALVSPSGVGGKYRQI
jgi:hypothetical protein